MDHTDELLEALRDFAESDLPFYSDCIRQSFSAVVPVFTRDRYEQFFFHCASTVPGWLPSVVLANADAESQGSEKLLWLWRGAASNAAISKDVLVHAKDESRHSRLFITLAEASFPNAFSNTWLHQKASGLFRIQPEKLTASRTCLPEETLMDHLVQMNMGEIRTRIHMLLLSPVIHAFTPQDRKERVRLILEGLVTDEIRHINYTAQFIEAWANDGANRRIRELFAQRLQEFHRITIAQTEAAVRAYGNGEYPDLLEI